MCGHGESGALSGPPSVHLFLHFLEELDFSKNGMSFPRKFLFLWLSSVLWPSRYILGFFDPTTWDTASGAGIHLRLFCLCSLFSSLARENSNPLSGVARKQLLHHPEVLSIFRLITSVLCSESSSVCSWYWNRVFETACTCIFVVNTLLPGDASQKPYFCLKMDESKRK